MGSSFLKAFVSTAAILNKNNHDHDKSRPVFGQLSSNTQVVHSSFLLDHDNESSAALTSFLLPTSNSHFRSSTFASSSAIEESVDMIFDSSEVKTFGNQMIVQESNINASSKLEGSIMKLAWLFRESDSETRSIVNGMFKEFSLVAWAYLKATPLKKKDLANLYYAVADKLEKTFFESRLRSFHENSIMYSKCWFVKLEGRENQIVRITLFRERPF